MGVIQRVVKPKTHKGKKVIQSREPKVIEDAKVTMFIRGKKCGDILTNCMRDLYSLRKPDAIMLGRKNDILPFENSAPIEQFSKKLNASLFMFGNSNKKRPNALILGRTYHHQLLDMIELTIDKYKSIKDFNCEKITTGLKPCLIFSGDGFEKTPELKRLQNLLIDTFQREPAKAIRLQGIEHAIMCTAQDDKVYFRSYRIMLKKSATQTPRIELEEIGPSIDFKLGRSKLASDDLLKVACKKPKELKIKKKKNISHDAFGATEGRIHIEKQNISRIQIKKMKGLKRKAPVEPSEPNAKATSTPSPRASKKSKRDKKISNKT